MSGVSAADCGWALSGRKRTPLDGKPLLLLRVTGFGCINASDNNNNNNNNKEKRRLPPSLKNTCKQTQH
jgi:hypothetical protein